LQHIQMINQLEEDAKVFRKGLDVFHQYLPDSTCLSTHAGYHQAPINFQIWIRDKRFLGRVSKDMFSTTMGLYNSHKLNKLKDHLEEVEVQQA